MHLQQTRLGKGIYAKSHSEDLAAIPGPKRSSVLSSHQQEKKEGKGFECHQKSLMERISRPGTKQAVARP